MVALKELLLQTLEAVEEKHVVEEDVKERLRSALLDFLRKQQTEYNESTERNSDEDQCLAKQKKSFQNQNREILYERKNTKNGENLKYFIVGPTFKPTKIKQRPLSERLQQLAEPKQLHHEDDFGLNRVPGSALNYRASRRIQKLAVPVQRSPQSPDHVFQVKRSALRAQCSKRIIELAQPNRIPQPPLDVKLLEFRKHKKPVMVKKTIEHESNKNDVKK